MMRALAFEVPGFPVAWHRTGGKGIRRYKDKKDREFQSRVALAARLAKGRDQWLLDGDFILDIESLVPNRIRRDADNLLKNVMDGLTGVLYRDDALVDEVHLRRRVVSRDEARTIVTIERVER